MTANITAESRGGGNPLSTYPRIYDHSAFRRAFIDVDPDRTEWAGRRVDVIAIERSS